MKIPRINIGWAFYFAFLGTMIVFGVQMTMKSSHEIEENREKWHNEITTEYEQLYCFDAQQGSDSWKAARAYLMTNHPDSLECKFARGKP